MNMTKEKVKKGSRTWKKNGEGKIKEQNLKKKAT
jgi:hypothetical protein